LSFIQIRFRQESLNKQRFQKKKKFRKEAPNRNFAAQNAADTRSTIGSAQKRKLAETRALVQMAKPEK